MVDGEPPERSIERERLLRDKYERFHTGLLYAWALDFENGAELVPEHKRGDREHILSICRGRGARLARCCTQAVFRKHFPNQPTPGARVQAAAAASALQLPSSSPPANQEALRQHARLGEDGDEDEEFGEGDENEEQHPRRGATSPPPAPALASRSPLSRHFRKTSSIGMTTPPSRR